MNIDVIALFAQATGLSAIGVYVATELLKLVPVQFTSRYPAWVNGICSIVASVFAVAPVVKLGFWGIVSTAVLIAVLAAMIYNHFASKVVNLNNAGTN